MTVYTYSLKTGIRRTPEFRKKRLADYAVNVGLTCGHACAYCSSRSLLRCHRAFPELGLSPFEFGYAIVDPQISEKVERDAKRIRSRGLVQLCTTVDAWAPEAQQFGLGRRCLQALLQEPGWTVRILTKNAVVAEDFDLLQQYRDRVLVGISLTGTPAMEDVVAAVEPHASPIKERLAALENASRMGLRTYGMLCPLLPGIAHQPNQIEQLVRFVRDSGAEEVFAEAVNPRGPGLKNTEEALRRAGFHDQASAVARVRTRAAWSPYVAILIQHVQSAMRKHMTTEKLRFLLYPTGLTERDARRIRSDDAGVVWL